ncbi:MAG: chemotaxis protein CheW [Acidobacteria bacterium]|nr:chemotaxis protein CheW [Acidobacteriota bacterium]
MIDWEQARRRLARSERGLEQALVADAQRVKRVWRERAARLARPPAEALSAVRPFLAFRLREETYALPLEELGEVIPNPACTPVPGAPAALAGVLNLRGQIRPVWDLARLLQLPEGESGDWVLLLRRPELGLRVGRAEQILHLRPEEFRVPLNAPPWVVGVSADALAWLDVQPLLQTAAPASSQERKES